MAQSDRLRKKWIDNFAKCPLVDRSTRQFRQTLAHQLFNGKTDDLYPADYPHGFKSFYNSSQNVDPVDAVDVAINYLDIIGIRLTPEIVKSHIAKNEVDLHHLLSATFFILRTLAHRETVDVTNPYVDNYGNIAFLIRLQTGEAQLAMFDEELPQLYGKQVVVPDGYDDDPVVTNFFSQIEQSNRSFFITGKAGTGKSTFIHYFAQRTKKTVALMAFTGLAAANVGGVTIHSFFQLPPRALVPGDEDILKFGEKTEKRRIIQDLDTIVIDEVSMLRADVLQAIDHSLRINGGDPASPFGGKQILFVGDLFQLPPVSNDTDEVEQFLFTELYDGPYFFDCDAYKDLNPGYLKFEKSYRQKDDTNFVELLDKVRSCKATQDDLDRINRRVNFDYIPKPNEFNITITSNNAIANEVNKKRISELHTSVFTFHAEIKGDYEEKNAPASPVLDLRQGAQVIFVKNDSSGQRRWVNGSIGKIEFIAKDVLEVRLPDGNTHKIEKETWERRKYKYDRSKRKIVSEVKGTFTQFPIKLAWAITIHKSQGLTFDKVIIDLGSGAFVNGQLYTALSRCRTLEGITLRRKIHPKDIIQDNRLIRFYDALS